MHKLQIMNMQNYLDKKLRSRNSYVQTAAYLQFLKLAADTDRFRSTDSRLYSAKNKTEFVEHANRVQPPETVFYLIYMMSPTPIHYKNGSRVYFYCGYQ